MIIIDIFGHILIIIGLFAILSAVLGAAKWQGFWPLLHASSVSDSFGTLCIIMGSGLLSHSFYHFCKFLLIFGLYLIFTPIGTMAIAQSYKQSIDHDDK